MPKKSPEEILYFLKKAHDQAVDLASKIEFDRDSALHRTSIALYSSIIELSGTCCSLVDNKQGAAIPIIVRALIEAYVDLTNLLKTPLYGNNLEVIYIKEWLKILEEARRGTNEYLDDIAAAPNLDETIKNFTNQKLKLQVKGYRSLTIEQKFTKAGMEKEYRSIYNSLCAYAHNNIRALMDRHFEREQGDLSMVLYKEYTLEDNLIYIGSTSELLVRATEDIHNKFKTKVIDQVRTLREEIDLLREEGY